MKRITIIITILVIFFGVYCKKSTKLGDVKEEVFAPKIDTIHQFVSNWRLEGLPLDSIFLFDSLPVVMTKAQLIRHFGQPDKKNQMEYDKSLFRVVWVASGFENKSVALWNYGATVFEVSGNYAILNTLDFRSTNIIMTTSKFILRLGQSPLELRKFSHIHLD